MSAEHIVAWVVIITGTCIFLVCVVSMIREEKLNLFWLLLLLVLIVSTAVSEFGAK